MTPMAILAAARVAGRDTPDSLLLLDRSLFKDGALAMGVGELFGDKLKSAPDRKVFHAGLSSQHSKYAFTTPETVGWTCSPRCVHK